MPSPFPGMDPYIESQGLWPDFHVKLINYLQETLADLLPDVYEVRIDERINFIHVQDDSLQRIRPDVSVAKVNSREATSTAATAMATVEPVTLPETSEEEVREAYIEILNRGDRSLVTILEVLSPANKAEPGRATCMTKRGTIIQQPGHLVATECLRG